MKATREEPMFQPVTITIETEKELIALWMMLNITKSKFNELTKHDDYPIPNISIYEMWDVIDEIIK